ISVQVVGEPYPRSEVLCRIRKGLPLVAKSQIQGQIRTDTEIILHEQRPECVIDRIAAVSEALGVAGNIVDIPEVGRAFADGYRQRAGVVLELAKENRSAEFLAIATVVGADHVAAKLDIVPPARDGQSIVELILPILQERGLRRARGKCAGPDWNYELRAQNHGIEFRDGRRQLKLKANIVENRGSQDSRLAEFRGIGTPLKNTIHARKVVASHGAIGIGVEETIRICAEK